MAKHKRNNKKSQKNLRTLGPDAARAIGLDPDCPRDQTLIQIFSAQLGKRVVWIGDYAMGVTPEASRGLFGIFLEARARLGGPGAAEFMYNELISEIPRNVKGIRTSRSACEQACMGDLDPARGFN